MSGEEVLHHRSWWRKIHKVLLITLAVIVVLVSLLIGGVVMYLHPGRLTPLVTDMASRYLLADVKASRVELSFWSTFPRVSVCIDSLTIDSRSLDGLTEEQRVALPEDSRRLLEINRFSGAINVSALSAGKVRLHNVVIDGPNVNLVRASDSIANYLIVPEDKDDKEKLTIPNITIDRFVVTGDSRLSYFSLPDSTDVKGRLVTTLSHDGNSQPVYSVELTGAGAGSIGSGLKLPEMPFGLNGRIGWSAENPYVVTAEDLTVSVDRLAVVLDTQMEFAGDTLNVRNLKLRTKDLKMADVIGMIPEEYRGELSRIASDLSFEVKAELTEPYRPGIDSIPSAKIDIIADGALDYDRLRLRNIKADLTVDINGQEPDMSVIDVRRLLLVTRAVGCEVNGTVTYPFTDPVVRGRFKGGIDLALLPKRLTDKIKVDMSGLVTGDASFGFRISDLVNSGFHHVKIDGDMRLKDMMVHKHDNKLTAFATATTLKFGTSSSLSLPVGTVDSLLVVSVLSDTMSFRFDHNRTYLTATGVKAGIGMKNISTSSDSTMVNPIGGRISVARAVLHSHHDSITVRIRDISSLATIKRYMGHAQIPELSVSLDAPAIRYTDPVNRATLNHSHIDFGLHLRVRDSSAVARRQARRDSIRTSRAGMNTDSLRLARQAQRRDRLQRDSAMIADGGALYLDVDKSFVRWLNRHEAAGRINASRGRIMSRYFPVGCRLNGLGLRMSTDSVCLDSMHLKSGSTTMTVSGKISNITRAIGSVRSPLQARFKVIADTIDINGLAEGVFAGSDFSRQRHLHRNITDDEDDDAVASSMRKEAKDAPRRALIVPSNLDGEFQIEATNVLYSDIWFQRLSGMVGIRDGAVNLDRLAAYTPIGSMDLTALYSAPRIDSLRFAAGIVIRRLQLHRFLRLMPQIDSLMPLLRDVDGTITADLAMSSELDSLLDLKFHTLEAVMRLEGDSLSLNDTETFRNIAKWLMFKHKNRFVVDHMDVALMVRDSRLDLFPFVFDIDRYRIGVSGSNDLKFNLDYHIAVLKSPLPFRFGINIKGRPGHLRFSLGRAHFNEYKAYSQRELTDTTRINLIREIEQVFRFGVSEGKRNLRLERLQRPDAAEFEVPDTISPTDSLLFIEAGVLPPSPAFRDSTTLQP